MPRSVSIKTQASSPLSPFFFSSRSSVTLDGYAHDERGIGSSALLLPVRVQRTPHQNESPASSFA
jgi:hypothetical protein